MDGFKAFCIAICIVLIGLVALLTGVVVPVGYVGVHTRFGNPIGLYSQGFNFKVPFIDKCVKMNTQDIKTSYEGEVSSKDMQTIKINSSIIVALDPAKAVQVYSKYRKNYMQTVVDPHIAEALNNEVAKYPIEGFVENKPAISNGIKNVVRDKLKDSGIIIKDFVITNHDFSDEYDKAVEAKKVAEQKANKAKYDLDRITLEAEAQKKKQASLTQTVLQEKWIEKWDGKLPQVINGNAPMMMNLGNSISK